MQRTVIALDLDGVLADFSGAANLVHGKPGYDVNEWNWYRQWGMSDVEFWRPIVEHHDFYSLVAPLPWANELLRTLNGCYCDLVIATANPPVPALAASKISWINRHIPFEVPVMMGPRKDLLARQNRILIDDYDKNLQKWVDNGGLAIRLNQPWNEGRFREAERMQDVYDRLLMYGVL